jgi:membrane-associated phospholipid phosphatase
VALRELRDKNVITYATSLYPFSALAETCRQNGVILDTRFSFPDAALLAELCETGRFAAFRTYSLGNPFTFLEIEDLALRLDFYLLVNRRAFTNRTVKTFVEYAEEKLGGKEEGQAAIGR